MQTASLFSVAGLCRLILKMQLLKRGNGFLRNTLELEVAERFIRNTFENCLHVHFGDEIVHRTESVRKLTIQQARDLVSIGEWPEELFPTGGRICLDAIQQSSRQNTSIVVDCGLEFLLRLSLKSMYVLFKSGYPPINKYMS